MHKYHINIDKCPRDKSEGATGRTEDKEETAREENGKRMHK